MYCRHCGLEIGNERICPVCGTDQSPVYNHAQQSCPPRRETRVRYESDMTVGDWILTLILTCIPIVNIICLLIWAFGDSSYHRSRQNWALAQLVLFLIIIAVAIFLIMIGVLVLPRI